MYVLTTSQESLIDAIFRDTDERLFIVIMYVITNATKLFHVAMFIEMTKYFFENFN